MRLLLTGLGTLLAVVAQFYPPGKVPTLLPAPRGSLRPPPQYPDNFAALIVCCPLYVVVNALVTYWLPGLEQDIVARTASRKGSPGVELRTALDDQAATYRAWTTRLGGGAPLTDATRELGALFCDDGTLYEPGVRALKEAVIKGKTA